MTDATLQQEAPECGMGESTEEALENALNEETQGTTTGETKPKERIIVSDAVIEALKALCAGDNATLDPCDDAKKGLAALQAAGKLAEAEELATALEMNPDLENCHCHDLPTVHNEGKTLGDLLNLFTSGSFLGVSSGVGLGSLLEKLLARRKKTPKDEATDKIDAELKRQAEAGGLTPAQFKEQLSKTLDQKFEEMGRPSTDLEHVEAFRKDKPELFAALASHPDLVEFSKDHDGTKTELYRNAVIEVCKMFLPEDTTVTQEDLDLVYKT